MTPAEQDNTNWTVIFIGAAGERSSMKVTMTKDKLPRFVTELKSKVIGYEYMDEVTDNPHKFKAIGVFAVEGHLLKKEEIKNASPFK